MNAAEFVTLDNEGGPCAPSRGSALTQSDTSPPGLDSLASLRLRAAHLATRNTRPLFITLAENGIIGATPGAPAEHIPALPIRGPIDIVGAGDSVTANLTAALAAGASVREALELAALASSVVIHQLGTSGAASPSEMARLLR